MSLPEMLDQIPKLSFVERQEVIRRAVECDDRDLSPADEAILDERLADFRRNPNAGISVGELKSAVLKRLRAE